MLIRLRAHLYVEGPLAAFHEFADPFAVLLGDTVVTAALEPRTSLAPVTTDVIDKAWEQMSAQWRYEVSRGRESPENEGTPAREIRVGGSKEMLLVGAEGLEPPASSL